MTYHYLPPGGINKMTPFQKPHWFTDCRWPHYGFFLSPLPLPSIFPPLSSGPLQLSWHPTFPNTTITSSINRPSRLHDCLLPSPPSSVLRSGSICINGHCGRPSLCQTPDPATPTMQNYCVICLLSCIFRPCVHGLHVSLFLLLFWKPHKTRLLPGPVALTGSRAYGRWIWVNIYEQAIFVSLLGSAVDHHNVKKKRVRAVYVYGVYRFTCLLFAGSLDAKNFLLACNDLIRGATRKMATHSQDCGAATWKPHHRNTKSQSVILNAQLAQKWVNPP